MSDVKESYDLSVRPLPPEERLRLAALILTDLTRPGAEPLEFKDNWSEIDVRDLAAHAAERSGERYPMNGDFV